MTVAASESFDRSAAWRAESPTERIGFEAFRLGLALIFLWIGGMKFTAYEAAGISPFILNSPLVGWWHSALGVQGASNMLGIVEITIGVLLLARPIFNAAFTLGAAMATLTFITTLTFLFTTPGIAEPKAGGFPALSPNGMFLLKDVALLGGSLLLFGAGLSRGDEDGALKTFGAVILRYGLATVLIWFGALRFTAYQAEALTPMLINSPLTSWLHGTLGAQGASNALGGVEIAAGALIAAYPLSRQMAVLGGILAIVTFALTITFLFTTPGVAEPKAGGFPALSAEVGQFLLKDVGLFGAAIWLTGQASSAQGERRFEGDEA